MIQDLTDFPEQIRSILHQRQKRRVEDPTLICAAVLVPLLFKEEEWHVLVTQRTQAVEHHRGQISFPGGACDPQDVGLMATALRETFEEVGVPPVEVEMLGELDDYPTITSFSVTPFVGVIPHPFPYRLNPEEVEAVIEVPLSFLRDASHLRIELREYGGHVHDVYFWDYGPVLYQGKPRMYTIWGATARILKDFLDLVFPD
jgi:8-oxo-dGTP pyrophosphatase MutT (NUDIX family)